MSDAHPPTADEMLNRAAAELDKALAAAEEALAWLRSDWRPLGTSLTDGQAARRQRLRETAAAIKRAVELTTREAGGDR